MKFITIESTLKTLLPPALHVVINPFLKLPSSRKQVSDAFYVCTLIARGVKKEKYSINWAPSSGMNQKGIFQSLVKARTEMVADLTLYSFIIFGKAGLM